MKNYQGIVSILFLFLATQVQAQTDVFHKNAREILNTYVLNGRVDYKALAQTPAKLNSAVVALEKIDVKSLQGNEKKAFIINAYNMLVLHAIVSKYPITSVMKIPGFFDKNTYSIGTGNYTLNQLEKEILYKEFPDARLHFALVCGAMSCPPLTSKLFTAANLESELNKITTSALNSDHLIKLDMHEKTVTVSKIFDWYKADFTKTGSRIDFINKYRMDKIPSGITLIHADYSWELNSK